MEKSLEQKVLELDRFLGNLSDYTSLKRQEGALLDCDTIVIMPTSQPVKFVHFPDNYRLFKIRSDSELLDIDTFLPLIKMIKNGCIGLIHYVPDDPDCGYGTPVKILRIGHPYR